MNSRNRYNHDPFDLFIERSLKNWLRYHVPPQDVKEKVLRAASADSVGGGDFHRLGLSFLRHISILAMSLLSFNQGQPRPSFFSQDSLLLDSSSHNWGAYEVMMRSAPAGRGLLCFLY
jgi:hypothetical protein